jgi:transcriptional regulator GlxA family with amidase domain
MDNIGTIAPAKRIGILPLPGFALMSYASIVEPMRVANLLARQALYEIMNFTTKDRMVPSSGSAFINADANIEDHPALDLLLVIAGENPTAYGDIRVLNWISHMARLCPMLGGVSGGPVILAKAGVMTGRRMTVNWEYAESLAEKSPNLTLEQTLFVIDRDRVTCAGGAAPMDMMHALISQDHGSRFAQLVSDWFLHADIGHPGGARQGGIVGRVGTLNTTVLDAVKAMEIHVANPLTLSQIASNTGVSERQLNRLFSDKLGQSTMGYYRVMRLKKAKNLLRSSSMPVAEIALATGFDNSSHFSTTYRNHFGEAPSKSRRRK